MLSRGLRHDGNQIVRLDEFAALVDEHAAVGVAVEDDAAVKPLLAHKRGNLLARLGLQGVRRMAGEGTVRRVVDDNRRREKLVRQKRRHAVGAVDGIAQPLRHPAVLPHPREIARQKGGGSLRF